LISKVPTFAFKKISIPRRMTIFALFGVVLFFGLLLIYTFKVLTISALIYLILIPVSFFHYQKNKKKHNFDNLDNDEKDDPKDVL
jgi:CDP-diacylglycerol--serine O-phosphatidyltransferase